MKDQLTKLISAWNLPEGFYYKVTSNGFAVATYFDGNFKEYTLEGLSPSLSEVQVRQLVDRVINNALKPLHENISEDKLQAIPDSRSNTPTKD